MMKIALSIFLLLLLCVTGNAQETWTPELSAKIKTIGSVSYSPDGNWILFSVTQFFVKASEGGQTTHIWITRADGSEVKPLTSGEASCSSPSWSPDGRYISYLSSKSGRRNIWLYDLEIQEEKQLTDVLLAVSQYKWSPDGKKIAFIMADMPDMSASRARAGITVVGEMKTYINLYTVDVHFNDGFSEHQKVTELNSVVMTFDWSNDSQSLYFSRQPTAHQDYLWDNDLYQLDLESKLITPLVERPGWDLGPLPSPDGKFVAFTTNDGDDSRAMHRYTTNMQLFNLSDGTVRKLAYTFSQLANPVSWARDSGGIYYLEAISTRTGVFKLPVDSGASETIFMPDAGVIGQISFNSDDSEMVFVWDRMDSLQEIFVMKTGNPSSIKQITKLNQELNDSVVWAESEVVSWKGAKGDSIEGLLTYPLNYEKTKKYPLVVIAHAGLFHHDQNNTARLNSYPVQTFSAEGFLVFRPNPHGSNNYTVPFRDAIKEDWAGIIYEDIMSGVDMLVDKGIADEDCMGVMGWSTGGYATSTVISRNNRFSAASIGAAPVNLVSFTNSSDSTRWLPHFFDVEVSEDKEPYEKQSPLFRMTDVQIPVLLQWGANDARVPISQGYELYYWLKTRGVEVTMQIIPKAGHGPTDPRLLIAVSNENVTWFKEHLKPSK